MTGATVKLLRDGFDPDAALEQCGTVPGTLSDGPSVSVWIQSVAAVVAALPKQHARLTSALASRVLKNVAADGGVPGGSEALTEAIKVARRQRVQHLRVESRQSGETWESELAVSDRGVAASTANVCAILQHHVEWGGVLAVDARAGQAVFRKRPPFPDEPQTTRYPRELRDTDMVRICAWLERSKYALMLSPKSEILHGAAALVGELHAYDPVRDYLDALKWDGSLRLDGLMIGYFGARLTGDLQERELQARCLAEFGAKFMLSAVARAFEPGCKADHVIVFRGKQGLGKSSAIKILAGEDHFGDGLPDLRSKDAADYLRGPWLIELSELEAVNRAELATIKAFLTRTEDRFRAAYGRRTESHARRCIFVATTNEDTFLRDATGNRRFWPVTVTDIRLDALARDRDQLWAEAVHRYRAGEPWHLTDREIIGAATEAQEDHAVVDVWQPAIEDYVSGKSHVTVADVLTHGIDLERARQGQTEANRVARTLTALGWTRSRVRIAGTLTRVYLAPMENANV